MLTTIPPSLPQKLAAAIVRIDDSVGLTGGSAFCHAYTGHQGKFVCTVDQGGQHNGTRCFKAVFWMVGKNVYVSGASETAISCANKGQLGA